MTVQAKVMLIQKESCRKIGMISEIVHLAEDTSEEDVLKNLTV